MKRSLTILLAFLGMLTLVHAQVTTPPQKSVPPKSSTPPTPPPPPANIYLVRNAIEFVDAIGSNRTIQLQSGTRINLPEAMDKQGDNYEFRSVYDGQELVISGVTGLKIIGLGNTPVELLTEPQYGNVLVFENCTSITIENVNAGHGPEKGACTGGVFYFLDSKNINIRNTIMYGSGIEGITAEGVIGLRVTNSTIWGCTYGIMSIMNSSGVTFNNCTFRDNEEFDLVNILNASDAVNFKSCTFTGNRTNQESYDEYALFNVNGAFPVVLENCTIKNNSTVYFSNRSDKVVLTNTINAENTYVNGMFKN